ncbi:MAG: homoserine dehydrogenase [Eubacteriales bacterium]|nr:homoserine dehydrogenase [Eubacteriales bacterium]MDD3881326.1 homoserine dehydrogenase [Eubacteriales bacterium]MDD4513698.1 homoserine dehydrogenase [Eubacteriales bacterium]
MKEVVIGFLGCGNIGCGVWELLQSFNKDIVHRDDVHITIKKMLVRDVNKQRNSPVPRELLTTEPDEVLSDPEITLVAEFMGGEQPATDYMLRALHAGKTVVTANKVALALNWHLLQAAAKENKAGLYYEASVCGAVPIIKTLTEALHANRISCVMGIINGTTNYILTEMMKRGCSYEEVLFDAQRLGLAEPNPSADVEGLDATYKLSIMASLAFHARIPVDKIYRNGITKVTKEDIAYADEMGYVIKLLAIAKRVGNTVEAHVYPTLIPREHMLAGVNGALNGVYIYGHACKEMMLIGRGAGDMPTASAVVSDILQAVTHTQHSYPTFQNTKEPSPEMSFDDDWETEYFIRLSAIDKPGVLSEIAGSFARNRVSIATLMQKGNATPGGRVALVLVTHKAHEMDLRSALRDLQSPDVSVDSMIRVEGRQPS